jgi:hypothetical protein
MVEKPIFPISVVRYFECLERPISEEESSLAMKWARENWLKLSIQEGNLEYLKSTLWLVLMANEFKFQGQGFEDLVSELVGWLNEDSTEEAKDLMLKFIADTRLRLK